MYNTIQRKYNFTFALVILLLGSFLVISSCGGGGGGGGGGAGSGGISYNGVTTQASITVANANKIFSVIWNGGSSSGSASLSPAISKAASFEYLEDGGMVSLFNRLKNRSLSDVTGFVVRSKNIIRATAVNETHYGSVSGTLTITGSIDPNTMTGSLTMTYVNFNDGDGYTYDGTVTFKVDGFDMMNGMITDATMNFTLWTIKSANSNVSLSGSIRVQESLQNNSDTLTVNMDGRDNIVNDTFRFQNFTITFSYNNVLSPPSSSETYIGQVYVGPYGYVDVSTTSPFVYSSYLQENPNSGGPIILIGAGNSKAAITPISTSYVKIEVDADGNGVYESKNAYSWSNLTGAAVTPHAAPTGVVALLGDRQITITWDTMLDAVGYNIYWSTTPGVTTTTGTKIAWAALGPYIHTGLNNGTTYYYVVTAAMADGTESSPSSEVSATPLAGATMALTQDATNLTDTTATLNGSFNISSGYTTTTWFEYGVTTAYGNSTPPATYMAAGNFTLIADISGLAQMTWYHYRLVTQNAAGTFYGYDKTFRTYVTPQIIVKGDSWNGIFDLDAGYIYWIDLSLHINKVPITGGAGTAIASVSSSVNPGALEVQSGNVFWTEMSVFWNVSGSIEKVGADGGPVSLVAYLSPGSSPHRLAVDSTSVYWCEWNTVNKVSINGGTVTPLATGCGGEGLIGVDSASVYWTDSGLLLKKSINGGPNIIIASVPPSVPLRITMGNGFIYWFDGGAIVKVSTDGGSVSTVVMIPTCESVTLDSQNIYFIAGNVLQKISINGGDITPLANVFTPFGLQRIFADADSLYYLKGEDIVKIPKSL